MGDSISIRVAVRDDVDNIFRLLDFYGGQQLLLPRSQDDISKYLANFIVAETDKRLIGCVAIRDFGNNLFEIRSLAVDRSMTKQGIGSKLVNFAVERCRLNGTCRVFALTHHPNIFLRLGFRLVDKSVFPEKIWADCDKCPKIDHCDEVAVVRE